MKDLEKIKSEDLACQVADANPANFAIEQEVAAMVGATVPAPTEPSADIQSVVEGAEKSWTVEKETEENTEPANGGNNGGGNSNSEEIG